MSTTHPPEVEPAVETAVDESATADVTPLRLDAATFASTAPEYLRDLKAGLAAEGYQPASLTVEARFDDDCPVATQTVADRVRDYVRAAAFLGAGQVVVTVTTTDAADEEAARTALRAVAERARREGVAFTTDGAIST
jgi:sugar phosphate isomerase/epimerase